MLKKVIAGVVIAAGISLGALEYNRAIEAEEAHRAAEIAEAETRRAAEIVEEEARRAAEVAAAQEEYDTFIGLPMPEGTDEGFFSRTKDDFTKARTSNISSRGGVFRIAHDQDGYRDVISRKSYAGNTIVRPEDYWKIDNKDRISTIYMAFQMHCIDSYIQYMEKEKNMPQDNFKVKEVFIGSASGYHPTEEDRTMSANMTLMIAYGKYAWGNYSTKEYAIELKCAMDAKRKIRWQSKGY